MRAGRRAAVFVSPGLFAALALAGLMPARQPQVVVPASVYAWGPARDEPEAGFDAAVALEAAEADWSAPDDTPITAAKHPMVQEALAAAAEGRFEAAAAGLAAFATAEPAAAEAGWALRRAALYWHGLGRKAQASAALERHDRTRASRESRAAALFFWSLRPARGDERERHARTYLERHAAHGPPDLRAVAEAGLAAARWRDSCDRLWNGLCVVSTDEQRTSVCGRSENVPRLAVRARDPEARREALRHATSALRVGEALDPRAVAPWRRRALREALGRAALIVAEDAIEALIAIEVPKQLSFIVEEYKHGSGIPKWERDYQEQLRRTAVSRRAFKRFVAIYSERLRSADRGVAAVIARHSAPAIVTAMQHLTLAVRKFEDDAYFDIHSKYDFPRPLKFDRGYCMFYVVDWPWALDVLLGSLRTLAGKPDYWTLGRYFDPGDGDEFSGPIAPG